MRTGHVRAVVLAFAVWGVALPTLPAAAATVPAGFSQSVVATGLSRPTAMAFAPDGRLFVCEQGGRVRVIRDGVLLPAPFARVTVDSAGERGLLGVAFDPQFAANNYVYLYYTATAPNVHNRVSRFTAAGDVAVPGSELVLLELNRLSGATNHNGGALHFGPDGKLYVAVGENANRPNAQTLTNLLGKVLRLNADGTVPADNPFYTTARGVNRAIWALGLRNPFTFSIHPVSGRMFINDVGAQTWEEINEGIPGANYGWPETEGPTARPPFTSPIYAYGRGSGRFVGCAITGGAIYHGLPTQFPADYIGTYFFADFCGGWINRLDPDTRTVRTFASGIDAPVDLAVGPEGALYYLARGSGSVVRVSYTSQAPLITQQPAGATVVIGEPVTFTVTAAGSPPIAYQWRRNGEDIPGATSPTYTVPFASLGLRHSVFHCLVSNGSGSVLSDPAVLTVVLRGGEQSGLPDFLDFKYPPTRSFDGDAR